MVTTLAHPPETKARLARLNAELILKSSNGVRSRAVVENNFANDSNQTFSDDKGDPSSYNVSRDLSAVLDGVASSQSRQASSLVKRHYAVNSSGKVKPNSLVRLTSDDHESWYAIFEDARGGEVHCVDGRNFQVINTKCPVAKKLIGKGIGDSVDLSNFDLGTVEVVEIC